MAFMGTHGLEELALDGRVLLFTLVLAVVSGLLFGVAPALQAMRVNLGRALGEAGSSGSSSLRFVRGNRTRLTLAIAEVAIAWCCSRGPACRRCARPCARSIPSCRSRT